MTIISNQSVYLQVRKMKEKGPVGTCEVCYDVPPAGFGISLTLTDEHT